MKKRLKGKYTDCEKVEDSSVAYEIITELDEYNSKLRYSENLSVLDISYELDELIKRYNYVRERNSFKL